MKPSKLVTGFVCAALLFPYVAFAGVALDEEYLNGVAFEGQSAQMMQIAALSDSEMESTEGAGWWVPVLFVARVLWGIFNPANIKNAGEGSDEVPEQDDDAAMGGVVVSQPSGSRGGWWSSWSWARR